MKKIITVSALSLLVGVSATMGVQKLLPSKESLLEDQLTEYTEELYFNQQQELLYKKRGDEKQLKVIDTTCLLASARLLNKKEIQDSTKKLCFR